LKRRFSKTITLVLSFLLLSVAAFAQTTAPSLELKDLGGRHFRLEDFKGKVILLNFWATWCPPCRTEVPELVKWQRKYRKQGLQVVGITYPPQTRAEVLRFTRKVGVNYPVALGTKETKHVFTSSETLPATVVIDSEGNIRDVIEGIVFPEEFAQKIKPLLTSQTRNLTITKRLAKRTSTHLQRATILVDAEGYRPTNVVLRRGIPARLTFIRKAAEGCGTEIVIPGFGINRPLPLNVSVVVSFTPNRSGRFKLTCGMDMFRGSLIVR
jgi:thiol-disulfide isomerase/thioredoxin